MQAAEGEGAPSPSAAPAPPPAALPVTTSLPNVITDGSKLERRRDGGGAAPGKIQKQGKIEPQMNTTSKGEATASGESNASSPKDGGKHPPMEDGVDEVPDFSFFNVVSASEPRLTTGPIRLYPGPHDDMPWWWKKRLGVKQ